MALEDDKVGRYCPLASVDFSSRSCVRAAQCIRYGLPASSQQLAAATRGV